MQEKNVVPNNIPPTCHQPSRLKSKSWNSLTLDDFACPPAIVKAVQILEQKARQLDYLLDPTASEVYCHDTIRIGPLSRKKMLGYSSISKAPKNRTHMHHIS